VKNDKVMDIFVVPRQADLLQAGWPDDDNSSGEPE
jgi:hypothetical protein